MERGGFNERATPPRTCTTCGRSPAPNAASITFSGGTVRWYCHGDGDPDPTCYMRATWVHAETLFSPETA